MVNIEPLSCSIFLCTTYTTPWCFVMLACGVPVVGVYLLAEWKTLWILIRWLRQKPSDLDLQRFFFSNKSGFSMTMVKIFAHSKIISSALCTYSKTPKTQNTARFELQKNSKYRIIWTPKSFEYRVIRTPKNLEWRILRTTKSLEYKI